MAAFSHLLVLVLLICGFVASKIPQELSESVKNCENSCLKTFPSEKSNSVEKLSDACQRGCRFFVLVNSVMGSVEGPIMGPTNDVSKGPTNDVSKGPTNDISKGPAKRSANDVPIEGPVKGPTDDGSIKGPTKGPAKRTINNEVSSDPQLLVAPVDPPASARTNNSKEACQASCMEAYKHTRERYACHEGCANMARENARAEERVRQAMLEEGARELASLAAVGPLLSSMFSQLYSAVGQPRFAVLVSTSEDAEGPRTEDVFLLEQPQDQTIFLHASESEPDDVLTDPALIRQLESSSSLDISLRLPEQHVRTFPAVEHAPRFTADHQSQHPNTVPADLLACLSTRYGVPKWLLGFLALITGVLTAWLCLEPWDRAAILEESSDKTLLVDSEDDEDEKSPLPPGNDMVKIPLEKV